MARFQPLMVAVWMALSMTACEQLVARERVEELRKDLDAVTAQIKVAEVEDARYSGGLVKALISARLATLRHTHAMLDQRAKSWTWGIGLRYTVDGKSFVANPANQEQAKALDLELAALRAKLVVQEVEASRYAGGLVQALTLASLATMRQTEALLDQRRLLLKYELPGYVVGSRPSSMPSAAAPAPAAAAPEPLGGVEIISIDTRVTESNTVWSRFAWRLLVRNTATHPVRFDATIEFHDKDGFIVDTSIGHGLAIGPQTEQMFTGFALIQAQGAPRVAQTLAKLRRTG